MLDKSGSQGEKKEFQLDGGREGDCMQAMEVGVPPVSRGPKRPVRHYINLTNGIEALSILQQHGVGMDQVRSGPWPLLL